MLNLIVAMTEKGVIGRNNTLPWHLSEDLKRFKKLTMAHPIIMGRKTYESIGKPLPGRKNIVITRNSSYGPIEGVDIVHSMDEGIRKGKAENSGEIFIIGGSGIFKEALPQVERVYLTLIHQDFEGDTFFPELNLDQDFKVTHQEKQTSAKGIPYSFIDAVRKPI